MPSIYRIGTHFYLRDSKLDKTGYSPIYLMLSYSSKKLRISTGLKVNKKKWDALQQKVLGADTVAKSINNQLATIKAKVIEATNTISLNKRLVTLDAIKEFLAHDRNATQRTLLTAAEQHNAEMQKLVKIKYCYKTYQYYLTTAGFLKRFLKDVYRRNDIFLEEIELTFAKKFENWILLNTRSTNNGMVKHIQRLKKIINWSVSEGWIKTNPIQSFHVAFHKFDRGFLTVDEVTRIEQAHLTHKTLIAVREQFLFQIYTGLSHSDLSTLQWKHIQYNHEGNNWIMKSREKTDVLITVPLLFRANEILERRKQNSKEEFIFNAYANQPYNRYLKLLARAIGLEKRITSHIGRHTFATTITLSNGVPIETVSKMLGHTKIATTQIYSKVTVSKIAGDMEKLMN